jgi:putative efflux protein, MATE family
MLVNGDTRSEKSKFLTEDIGKLLLKFSIPAILSLLVAEMYNMVDSLFLGQVIGPVGIGALTIAFPVQRLFFAISMLVAIGASSVVARSCGENDYSKVKRIIPNAFIVLTSIILFLVIGIFIFRDSLIIKLGSSENIFPYAKAYISIILAGALFQGLMLLMAYILTAFGNTKIVLSSISIGAICNVIMNYILVVKFNFGVEGAAGATVSSQIVAFIYALIKFMQNKKQMNLIFENKLDKSIAKGIIFIGFSTFIVEISDAILAVVLNKILAQIGGDTGIVAVGLVSRVSMILFITVIGISAAMQPIVSYNYGAENYDRVKKIVGLSIKSVTITSIFLWVLTMIFTKQIIGLFVNDQNIINYTVSAFRLVIAVFPCVGVYFVAIYYYQAMGMARASVLLSIFREILVLIPLLHIMVYGLRLGVIGAWTAYPAADIISFVVAVIYIKCNRVESIENVPIKIKAKIATA